MKEISSQEAKKFGIREYHTEMNNQEKRFRLVSDKDNTSYIRTEASDEGGLQNSHYHLNLKEMYIVQSGKIDIYQYIDGKMEKNTVCEGEYFCIDVNIPHNVYMYPNAISHTVKFGKCDSSDWHAFEELDKIIEKENLYR